MGRGRVPSAEAPIPTQQPPSSKSVSGEPGSAKAAKGVAKGDGGGHEAPGPDPQGPISKAQEAVDRLLQGIRTKADQKVEQEASQGGQAPEERVALRDRDDSGRFNPGHVAIQGLRPPKSVREVIKGLTDGTIEVRFKDPLTGEATTAAIAHLMAEKIVEALNDPDNYVTMIKSLLEYGIGKPATADEQSAAQIKRIPRMIFLHEIKDPLARPGDPAKPSRLLGQVAAPDGTIIDYETGQPVSGMLYGNVKKDDGLGQGDERLEIVTDDGEPI